ncbi:MAG TPA: TolC family protein [Armatimonadota bacterium]|nr:TolC family protein [Armatimonadota bacterium]
MSSLFNIYRGALTRALCACCVVLLLAAGAAHAEKLTLAESISIALKNNPAVLIAKESVRKADASIAEATAAGMPKLTVEGTYERVDEVPIATIGDRSIELGNLYTRTADLELAQPIDVFGVVSLGRKAAVAQKSSFRHGYDGQVNDTTLDTKVAFYSVLRAQKFLKVEEDTIAQLEAHLKDAQAHYAAGTIAKFDVLRAETELANARQGLITAQNGVELAKAAFNSVLGRPLDTAVDLFEPEMPGFVDVELAACTDSASRLRPEVLQANMVVEVSHRTTKIARLLGKPRFNLRWAYNRNLDVTMFNPRESSWRAFLTSSISLFDGGATRAQVDRAISDTNDAKLTRQQVIDGVTLDAKQSYLNLNEGQERIRAAEKGLEQARESMRLAQARYKGGVSTQIEVLDAQAALTLAETNYVNAQYDYQVALAKLERAVGGATQMARLIGNEPLATAE